MMQHDHSSSRELGKDLSEIDPPPLPPRRPTLRPGMKGYRNRIEWVPRLIEWESDSSVHDDDDAKSTKDTTGHISKKS